MRSPSFIIIDDYRSLPDASWLWPNFRPVEFACRGYPGKHTLKIAVELLDKLQALRRAVARPMVVTSGFRSLGYNATLAGAAPNSTHVQGLAADISMANFVGEEAAFYRQARVTGFSGFGFYPEHHNLFIHLDLGRPRWWGNPAPWKIVPT